MDYLCSLHGKRLGVSVTRAQKYKGTFKIEDATKLITKKLEQMKAATETTDDGWESQVLHVWAYTANAAEMIRAAYKEIIDTKKIDTNTINDNTVLMVTTVFIG